MQKSRRLLSSCRAGTLIGLVLVLMLVLWSSGCDWGGTLDSIPAVTSTTVTTGGSSGSASVVTGGDGLVSPAAEVARVLGPSVVNIKCTGTASVPDYFQVPGQQQYATEWEGSGVIYSADGKIVTNNHVVTGGSANPAADIEVTLATGEKLKATVVGTDPLTDSGGDRGDGRSRPAGSDVRDRPTGAGRIRGRVG